MNLFGHARFLVALLLSVTPQLAMAEQAAWTLAVIGDQQVPVSQPALLDRFTSQTEWLAAHADDVNLRMVVQVGDAVEHGDNLSEWARASSAMQVLDTAAHPDGRVGVPWSVAYGNHEIVGVTRNPTIDLAGPAPSLNYRKNFGSASGAHRYANQPEFGGVSANDLNTWHLIRSSDAPDARPYLMLNLEVDVPGEKPGTNFDAIQWAQGVINAHPNVATIVTTHVFEGTSSGPPNNPYIYGFGHNSQLEIFDKLIADNSQIFMVLSGHTSQETHQVKLNSAGMPVLQMTTDYNKWLGQGGDGYFRLLEIDEEANEVRVKTYSALLDQYRTTPLGEFTFEVNLSARSAQAPAPPPRPIGHWRLDDGETNPLTMSAAGASSSLAHGSWADLQTPRWTSGISGGAAAFGGNGTSTSASPGIDDVISVEEGAALDVTGALTISAWVKSNDQLAGRASTRLIAGKDRAGGESGDAYSLKHDMTNNSNLLQFMLSSGGENTTLASAHTLSEYSEQSTLGGWVLVTGVFQPGKFMRLYIDGVIDAEIVDASVPTEIDLVPSTPFNVGRLHNSTSHSFAGAIDDVQLYATALTAQQVAILYANPGRSIDELASLAADFNNDGVVDGADLTLWRAGFGVDARGDADGDGVTDGNDFLAWQRSAELHSSGVIRVPEPLLCTYGAWGILSGRFLCRRSMRQPRILRKGTT